jgi:parallel beta-helix repeat protein
MIRIRQKTDQPTQFWISRVKKIAFLIGVALISACGSTDNSALAPVTISSCLPATAINVTVNVKDEGAKGDGVTDDTAAIQRAIDRLGAIGGTVVIPSGVYLVDAGVSIRPRNRTTLQLANGTILKAIPNDKPRYAVVLISSVSDVNVLGGTVQGERNNHIGNSGEWGMGIQIMSSRNVVIESVTSRDAWGDGFYIGGSASGGTSLNVKLCQVVADNNRRQGLSAVFVQGLLVKNSQFSLTQGTSPELGIDIEPNLGQTVRDVTILDSVIEGNAGGGASFGLDPAHKDSTFIKNVVFEGNKVANNGRNGLWRERFGVAFAGSVQSVIRNNQIIGNEGTGLSVRRAVMSTLSGNAIQATRPQSNIFSHNGVGVFVEDSQSTQLLSNQIFDNQSHGIYLLRSPDTINNENKLFNNGL